MTKALLFTAGTNNLDDLFGKMPSRTTASDTTLTASDVYLRANASEGDITVTLPAAADFTGFGFIVKHVAATHTVTVAAADGETIDGLESVALDGMERVSVVSNGTGWDEL